MSTRPASFDGLVPDPELVADGWQPILFGAFIDLIGPLYSRPHHNVQQFCFRVAPKHNNVVGRLHGGMMMSFLDEALGWTALAARPNTKFFTVGFDCQFMGGSNVGDLVLAETQVVTATRSLMFVRGDCKVGDRTIAAASGIWKVIPLRE